MKRPIGRRMVAATAVTSTSLLGASLASKSGSTRFYRLTAGVAITQLAGSLLAGPPPLGRVQATRSLALGTGSFALFYGGARVARHVPPLARAVASVFGYQDQGSKALVLLTALTNGAAEEVFFRGAVYSVVGGPPVLRTTIVYALCTCATRNPALVLASLPMGLVFARQRRSSGGILAPVLTHLTWSTLMLRFVPPLFRAA